MATLVGACRLIGSVLWAHMSETDCGHRWVNTVGEIGVATDCVINALGESGVAPMAASLSWGESRTRNAVVIAAYTVSLFRVLALGL
jgi:hypothetical protein